MQVVMFIYVTCHQALAKSLKMTKELMTSLGLDSVNWVDELRLIGLSCLLTAIIVKSIHLIGERSARYPAITSAVDSFASCFYKPPPHLRRAPTDRLRRQHSTLPCPEVPQTEILSLAPATGLDIKIDLLTTPKLIDRENSTQTLS
ncbi:hypothetical protein F4677DRAFT_351264 [Hypoxylon crocopeplum]|nr:hypothetical protein F4677DRAFT_351264 [Hypoxylon crocopeplum]